MIDLYWKIPLKWGQFARWSKYWTYHHEESMNLEKKKTVDHILLEYQHLNGARVPPTTFEKIHGQRVRMRPIKYLTFDSLPSYSLSATGATPSPPQSMDCWRPTPSAEIKSVRSVFCWQSCANERTSARGKPNSNSTKTATRTWPSTMKYVLR